MDSVWDRVALLARSERATLTAVARAEGCSAEDAIDVVQDALCSMLALARHDGLPTNDEEWAPFLTGIVRNAARNRRRRHFVARPHEEISVVAPADATLRGADELIARAEEHVRLQACVAELCEIQRAVVTLRMLEEQRGEDVATALGITPGYVAVLLLRAKQALRTCMSQA